MRVDDFLADFFREDDTVRVNAIELQRVLVYKQKLARDLKMMQERCLVAEERNKELLNKIELLKSIDKSLYVDLRA